MGTVLRIHSLSLSPRAIVVVSGLPSRARTSKSQGTRMRSAGAICGSHPATSSSLAQQKGRCMPWSCPNVEFGHSCGTHPGADAGKLCWVQQRGHCTEQRPSWHFIAALLENVRHWRLLNASEIHATKRGIPHWLPGQTKPSHYINIYILQEC